ncbi:MAG: hypothetical protein HY657_08165 [Acidobacteria bacterium]|nr:hypothetical protein [Acidobacteriota bacterium]
MSLLSVPALGGVRGADEDSARDRRTLVRALAPAEIVASGFRAIGGVAVDAGGGILVADRERGTLARIDEAGRLTVLLRHLRGPTGLAVDREGGVLIIEQGGRHLLRLAPDGTVATVAWALRQARAVAVGPDGRVWIAVRRAPGRGRDDDDDRDDRGSEHVIARLDESGTPVPFASGFVDVQGLAVDARAAYVAMTRLAGDRGRSRTTLARIPIRPDGSPGVVEPLWRAAPPHVSRGVAIDAEGDVFVSGVSGGDGDGNGPREAVVLKRPMEGRTETFASGPSESVLAFAPNGDLIGAETRHPGRVIRFRAPRPPAVEAPAFTNRTPLTVEGAAEGGARIAVARAVTPRTPLASTVADASTGTFALAVPLEPNATNALRAVATGAAGAGLASAPTLLEIVHDEVPPSLIIVEPMSGLHTREPVASSARAEDDRSGVAALQWELDGAVVARVGNPAPEEPFAAGAILETAALAEGPHAIDVAALDRAGNERVAAVGIVVDRTPPDTAIVSGPPPVTAERNVAFTVTGADTWSPVEWLEFAWRLDEGAWAPFEARPVVALNDLAPGAHRFEVKARDRAGNEDATPAAQAFTVQSLQLRILEPAPGALITTESVWVRGVVDGGAGEVTVSLPLPAQFGIDTVTAPVEGNTFAIEAPADPAFTTLTLTAIDEGGGTAQAEVSIVVSGDRVAEERLDVWPPGGLAPLTVRIGVRGLAGARVAVDVDGDGTDEFDGQPDGDDLYFTYASPGTYLPTVRVTNAQGEVSTRRAAVEVYGRAALDARLQAVWRGFKDALREGDVQQAVTFIAAERRAAWAEYFSTLPPEAFEDVDLVFTTLTLVQVGYGGAQYEMVAERDGLVYSYAVWFQTDVDGRWRLWRF